MNEMAKHDSIMVPKNTYQAENLPTELQVTPPQKSSVGPVSEGDQLQYGDEDSPERYLLENGQLTPKATSTNVFYKRDNEYDPSDAGGRSISVIPTTADNQAVIEYENEEKDF